MKIRAIKEAIEALREGKEIQSCLNKLKYKMREGVILEQDSTGVITEYEEDEPIFSLDEIMANWYIND